MPLLQTNFISEQQASGAQIIDGSLKFNAGKSEHLKRTPGGASNRRTWTWDCMG